MSGYIIVSAVAVYFLILYGISWVTGRNASDEAYFRGNRSSPWYVVAFGMIGASLSGVTFISVPGWVGTSQFSYLQMVAGYLIGYAVIAQVLIPLYYRENLTSIYGYLGSRFGTRSYRTGSLFFLISRVIGASFRLYLVALVFRILIQKMGFDVPFFVPVVISIALIYVYTMRGGIKTVVWTDTLQTACLLFAAMLTVFWILRHMDMDFGTLWQTARASSLTQVLVWDWSASNHLIKHLVSGAFIAIVMTGLDQDMMQKNLTCRTAAESQKNIYWFCGILVIANVLVLGLGMLLYLFGESEGVLQLGREGMAPLAMIDAATGEWVARGTDELYPRMAMDYLGGLVMLTFTLGLIAAAYSSADSALTALTTSFCVDLLRFETVERSDAVRERIRKRVQLGFAGLILLTILVFDQINDQAVITSIFKVAGYTYGPLLGLFSFGLLWERQVNDRWVPMICVAAPLLTFGIDVYASRLIEFEFGFLVLPLNGAITFAGLCAARRPVQGT